MAGIATPGVGIYTPHAVAQPSRTSQRFIFVANAALLLGCASMYFGTGWSLVLFSFPIASQLTPATYYLQFVPQVAAATRFFTYMTSVMLLSGAVMAWSEWRTGYRWVPIAVLALIVAATGLTMTLIFPLNQEMAARISDPTRLRVVLDRWMSLNTIRVILWTAQWLIVTWYFVHKAMRAPKQSS
jgi:hypothetical protein